MNPATETCSVLIVDDESNIRLMLRTTLASEGYAVTEAENGADGLVAIQRAQPQVVLLDLSMPTMDGLTFLQRLNEANPKARPAVIVLTAYGTIDVAVKAMKLGAVDFIEKPATPVDVRAAVESAIVQLAAQHDDPHDPEPGYDDTLADIRDALRAGNLRSVELMLMRAGTIAPHNDASYLNLAGVFHEASGRLTSAKKFYTRSKQSDPHFAAADENLKRLYELDTFNRTGRRVALGDEWQPTDIPGTPGRLAFGRLLRLLNDSGKKPNNP